MSYEEDIFVSAHCLNYDGKTTKLSQKEIAALHLPKDLNIIST